MSETLNNPSETQELFGRTIDACDPAALHQALQLAVDYRGDVSITRRSTGQTIEGYLFDCARDRAADEMIARLIPKNSDERIRIPFSDIAMLAFTGKDTASGKSFENWIRKYAQKKLAGESASIESESLDSE